MNYKYRCPTNVPEYDFLRDMCPFTPDDEDCCGNIYWTDGLVWQCETESRKGYFVDEKDDLNG